MSINYRLLVELSDENSSVVVPVDTFQQVEVTVADPDGNFVRATLAQLVSVANAISAAEINAPDVGSGNESTTDETPSE